MIDRVSGNVVEAGKDYLTIMLGGIGLRVFVTKHLVNEYDKHVELFTHLIVRETELSLYGFESAEERAVFEAIIKVNGVGPKLGLAILGTLNIQQLRNAVSQEKAEVLTRVPGIGKKTAQKILLELKDKIGWAVTLDSIPMVSDVDSDVLATLTVLGYSVVEAQSAIQSIPRDAPDEVEERVRLALQYFT